MQVFTTLKLLGQPIPLLQEDIRAAANRRARMGTIFFTFLLFILNSFDMLMKG